jgi:ABC-type dipeptide/oligopeptide/nickel transport system permease component
MALLGGTALAWTTAGRPSLPRKLIQAVSVTPLFLLAHVLVHGLNEGAWAAMNAGLVDRPSWFALPDQPSSLRMALAIALLAVGSGALVDVHGEVEDALVRIRQSGYVDAARARGVPVWPHVLWNLVPPLAAITVSRVAFFVGGLVILEKVMLLNGVGAILWQAAQLRDYNVALGITIVLAGAVAATRLVGDTVRLLVDPRLSAEGLR